MHLEAFGILVGDDRERGVAVDHVRRVDELAVDLAGERGLGEAGADRRGDVARRRRGRRTDGPSRREVVWQAWCLQGRSEAVPAKRRRRPGGAHDAKIVTGLQKKVRTSRTFSVSRDVRTRLYVCSVSKRVRGVITIPSPYFPSSLRSSCQCNENKAQRSGSRSSAHDTSSGPRGGPRRASGREGGQPIRVSRATTTTPRR